jgi:hypothetical protein
MRSKPLTQFLAQAWPAQAHEGPRPIADLHALLQPIMLIIEGLLLVTTRQENALRRRHGVGTREFFLPPWGIASLGSSIQ